MKVLVTGGAGYIASHTNVVLMNAGYDVVAVDNFANSNIENVKNVEKIVGKSIQFVEGDVCDAKLMNEIFEKHKIDAVIHFAGLKAVGESCVKPLLYYKNNLCSTLTLVDAMKNHGVKNLVFSSSATVYGDPKELPITETSQVGGTTNPYGTTKFMIERILSDVYASDPTWHIALLRYFNPVGAHESGRIGEDPKGIPNNLMPYVAKVAFGELPCIRVFGNDYSTKDGTGVRDYIHVMDLSEGHLAALKNIEKFGATPINLGTGIGYSVLDMIHAFSKACGKDLPYEIVERRPGDIASCYASPDKAKEFIGWQATRTLEDMCKDTWNFQKNRVSKS